MSLNAVRHHRHSSRSKRPYAPGCTGKTRFRSKEHAKEARVGIRYLAQSTAEGPIHVPIREYFCRNCSGYHLTSKAEARHEWENLDGQ